MNILMVASECVPYVKTGGLADVVGTLPRYLKKLGHDVRIILPKYHSIDGKLYNLETLPYQLQVRVGKETEFFRIKYCLSEDQIPVYFIENMRYFNRPGIYGIDGGDYSDNRERFIFFCRAVLEATKALMFRPDVIHCHDWQTALIPAYLKTVFRDDGFFWSTSTAFTIHNIAYQGQFGADTIEVGGFLWEDFTPAKLEFYNNLNFMKAALVLADGVSTVSPTYAQEIKEFNGKGLEMVLNSRTDEIFGILNGLDYDYWNPATDRNIAANYSPQDLNGKKICKMDLQNLCGFDVNDDAYLLGCVSRLDNQKGFDIILDAMYLLDDKNIQFVILGGGDPIIKRQLIEIKNTYPKNVAVFFDYNEPVAHKIYAGSDAYMMPSKFEPCGLSQMIALTYGAIPIVNRTGGLSDTIQSFNSETGEGNGFVFNITYGENFVETILKSAQVFNDRHQWAQLMTNAFNSKFTWDDSVEYYQEMYQYLISKKEYETVYR
ncbi:MAG: glycogen synthase [Elusimicrobiota bacterium]|jgi:starch synthase|nr:glycogen synthase [Elusimicrobiota bacterium]